MSTYEEVLCEYNKVKEDFDEHKKITEEYEKELEETIKEYDQKIQDLKQENEKSTKEFSKMKQDYLQYKEKNLEKMKEIQFLEEQADKFKQTIEIGKEEKSKMDRKIILLENDNNDFFNKVRELESWAEELNIKLEAALEENIILHNENEVSKLEMQEAIQRLQEELEETKNEITSKDKIINRITIHRDFLLKTAYNVQDDLNNNVISSESYHNLKKSSSTGKINELTPVNKNTKIPEKFLESYSNSFLNLQEENKPNIDKKIEEISVDQQKFKENLDEEKNENRDNHLSSAKKSINLDPENTKNNSREITVNLEKACSRRISYVQLEKIISRDFKGSFVYNDLEKIDNNDDDEDKMFIREKIDMEIQNILDSRRNFIINTLTMENFSFDYVGISKVLSKEISNNKFKLSDSNSKVNFIKNSKNQRLVENIDEMLSKIQARKEKVLMQKKIMQNKLEKIGIRMC